MPRSKTLTLACSAATPSLFDAWAISTRNPTQLARLPACLALFLFLLARTRRASKQKNLSLKSKRECIAPCSLEAPRRCQRQRRRNRWPAAVPGPFLRPQPPPPPLWQRASLGPPRPPPGSTPTAATIPSSCPTASTSREREALLLRRRLPLRRRPLLAPQPGCSRRRRARAGSRSSTRSSLPDPVRFRRFSLSFFFFVFAPQLFQREK